MTSATTSIFVEQGAFVADCQHSYRTIDLKDKHSRILTLYFDNRESLESLIEAARDVLATIPEPVVEAAVRNEAAS